MTWEFAVIKGSYCVIGVHIVNYKGSAGVRGGESLLEVEVVLGRGEGVSWDHTLITHLSYA